MTKFGDCDENVTDKCRSLLKCTVCGEQLCVKFPGGCVDVTTLAGLCDNCRSMHEEAAKSLGSE